MFKRRGGMVVDKENGKIDGDLFNWSFATQTESFAKFNQYKNNFDGDPYRYLTFLSQFNLLGNDVFVLQRSRDFRSVLNAAEHCKEMKTDIY